MVVHGIVFGIESVDKTCDILWSASLWLIPSLSSLIFIFILCKYTDKYFSKIWNPGNPKCYAIAFVRGTGSLFSLNNILVLIAVLQPCWCANLTNLGPGWPTCPCLIKFVSVWLCSEGKIYKIFKIFSAYFLQRFCPQWDCTDVEIRF